jgi:lipopolysaccharide export system protein LptC
MTSTVDELGTRGFAARPDNQAIFMRAKRHSRMVRLLRVLVPVGTAVVIAGIMLLSWLDPMRILARLPTAQGQLVISGTKITMEAPKLAGFTKDGRSYELNARAAAQDITKPDIVELRDIRARMEAQDRTPISLTAVDGVFDRKSGILKLAKDVMLRTPSYEVNLEEAIVDTTTNNVVSNRPVQVRMLQGVVNSKRLEVDKGGEVVRFVGGVTMTLENMPDLGANRPGGPR